MTTQAPVTSVQRPQAHRLAFTLVEMMIAITLFGAIMAGVYSTWNCIIRGTRVALKAGADAQRGRVAIHAIEQALVTAQLYNENNQYYGFVVDTTGKFAAIQMTSRLPATFLASSYFGDEVVRQVTFYVKRDPNDYYVNNLVMAQVPIMDVTEQENPYEIILARDVSVFELEFWKPGDKEFKNSFESTNNLPKLVRINLGIGHLPERSDVPFQYMMRLVNIPTDLIMTRF